MSDKISRPSAQDIEANREKLDGFIAEAVDTHGLFVQGVIGSPPFCYTVGVKKTLGKPEFIMQGFAPDLMHQLLNGLYHGLRSGQIELPEGGGLAYNLIADLPVKLVPLSPAVASNFILSAYRYYEGMFDREDVDCWQVLLPDVNGLFPGDEGCNPQYVTGQSLTSHMN